MFGTNGSSAKTMPMIVMITGCGTRIRSASGVVTMAQRKTVNRRVSCATWSSCQTFRHTPVRNARVGVFLAKGDIAQLLVEAEGLGLRVQLQFAAAVRPTRVLDRQHQRRAETGAAGTLADGESAQQHDPLAA